LRARRDYLSTAAAHEAAAADRRNARAYLDFRGLDESLMPGAVARFRNLSLSGSFEDLVVSGVRSNDAEVRLALMEAGYSGSDLEEVAADLASSEDLSQLQERISRISDNIRPDRFMEVFGSRVGGPLGEIFKTSMDDVMNKFNQSMGDGYIRIREVGND